LQSNGRERYH